MKRKRRPPAPLPASAPADNSVLTAKQVAAWLQIGERQLDRIPGLPYVPAGGTRSKRYLVRTVVTWLETQKREQKGTP